MRVFRVRPDSGRRVTTPWDDPTAAWLGSCAPEPIPVQAALRVGVIDLAGSLLDTRPTDPGGCAGDDPEHGKGDDLQSGLADRMREHTAGWHARAERTGIVHAILGGTADRHGYALFLRNLLPVYRALEGELERNRGLPGLDPIARPEVYRSVALESDLLNIVGPDWHLRLPLLPESRSLSSRIAGLAESGDGARLIAHAYTRFLGDLNGGQILQRLLMRSLRLKPAELAFYRFPAIADLGVFKREYREAFDRADRAIASSEQVIEESALAFEFNIALSQAVQDAVIRQRSGTV